MLCREDREKEKVEGLLGLEHIRPWVGCRCLNTGCMLSSLAIYSRGDFSFSRTVVPGCGDGWFRCAKCIYDDFGRGMRFVQRLMNM